MVQKRSWPIIARTVRRRVSHRRQLCALALGLMALVGVNSTTAQASAANAKVPVDQAAKMPPLPPAVIDDTLVIGGEDIDASLLSTRMTVGVQVNNHGPYRFIVDSGADTSVIGTSVARALQLPAGAPVTLHSMTDSGRVDRVLVDEIVLGQTALRDLQLPLLRDRDIGAHGMIGIDALHQQRLMMDFEKRVINIEDARIPAPRLDGEIIVTARLRHGQLILTQVTMNRMPVEAVIDTGTEVSIGNLALRDKLIHRNLNELEKVGTIGVTGVTMNLQVAAIGELRLGPVILRNIPIAFADAPPFSVFGLSDRPAMLIGTDLMEKFRRVSLDFRARKVRFQLRRCETTTITINAEIPSRILAAKETAEACKR